MMTGEGMGPGREQRKGPRGTDHRSQRTEFAGTQLWEAKEYASIYTEYLLELEVKEPGLITT